MATKPITPYQPGLRAFIVYDRLPERCSIHTITDDECEPLLRPGEQVVVDTSDRMPTTDDLFVIEYRSGLRPQRYVVRFRSRVMSVGIPGNLDADGNHIFRKELCWWASAFNQEEREGVIRMSDGPYVFDEEGRCDYLTDRLIGRVVGIYQAKFEEPRLIGD